MAEVASNESHGSAATSPLVLDADLVAEQMGFSQDERHKLHWAGLIHDIGKLSVPAAVLNKTDPLTEREWAQIRMHPNEGWAIVQPLREWLGEWAEATRDHHERWDGTGYPYGLRGEEIGLGARLVAVADVYDALTSERVYKKAMPHSEAKRIIIEGVGSHFDPTIVEGFLRAEDEFERIAREMR